MQWSATKCGFFLLSDLFPNDVEGASEHWNITRWIAFCSHYLGQLHITVISFTELFLLNKKILQRQFTFSTEMLNKDSRVIYICSSKRISSIWKLSDKQNTTNRIPWRKWQQNNIPCAKYKHNRQRHLVVKPWLSLKLEKKNKRKSHFVALQCTVYELLLACIYGAC